MDDDLETVQTANAPLDSDNEQSKAEPEGDKPEGEEKAETKEEGEADSGETAEQAGEADEEPDEEEDKPKKKRLGRTERLQRRLAAIEAENAALRRSVSDGEITRDMVEKEIGKPPKEEEFKGDFLAYERAMTAYELDARQVTRELRKNRDIAKQSRENAIIELRQDHDERVEEFRKLVPDFDKTVAGGIQPNDTVALLILESPKSEHLYYSLKKNPDRLDRLNRMSEREAAREIGRIESRLSLPSPKTETKAPKPPAPPPKGGSAPSSHERERDAWLAERYPHRYGKRA